MTNMWVQQEAVEPEDNSSDSIFVSGSEFLANIEKIQWEDAHENYRESQGDRIISVQFRNCGTHYNNMVQFLKLKVMAPKEATAKRAINLLSAIDAATGAGLPWNGQPPTDEQLQAAAGKPLIYKLSVWKMNGNEGNNINWIRKFEGEEPVKPTKRAKAEAPQSFAPPPASSAWSMPPVNVAGSTPAPAPSTNLDDDIPFS